MTWFYVWAGAVIERDLAPRVHDPHSWWQAAQLEQIVTWTNKWRTRTESAG